MNSDSLVLTALGVLALVALVLTWVLLRLRRGTRRELAAAQAEAERLQARVGEVERRLTAREAPAEREIAEYTITDLGRPEPEESLGEGTEPVTIDRALFADLVLRETVVRAASLAHGVRRALAPETRNRIRFEVRREIRRSRKQRKADLREARREWEARQRAAMDDQTDQTGDENAA
jgi:hypothetical protein